MAKLPIPFGNPRTYNGHSGVDYPQARRTPFRASGPGVVRNWGKNDRGGNFIWVVYDGGTPPVGYHHLPSHEGCPKPGTRFNLGDQLGLVNSSGFSTGDHLHSEVEGYRTTSGYWQWFDVNRVVGQGTASGGSSTVFDQNLRDRQAWLIARGYDLGPSGADGYWGAYTEAAIKAYQTFLRAYGYTGAIDADWGPGTQAAHEKYAATLLPASGTPAFPLAANQYFGPEGGGANSISGWHSGPDGHPGLRQWQQRMKDRGWTIAVDGLYGPKGATTPVGETAGVALAFQREKGFLPDALIGPETWKGAWEAPVTTTPVPTPTPLPDPEPTPSPSGMVTPAATDFPSWIRYDIRLDPEAQVEGYAQKWEDYYKRPYKPIESHTHWWGDPTAGYTHDGTVNHTFNTEYLGVNYVTSAGRITLCVPLHLNALTTGQRNPDAWKSENDPRLTELGYKTLGFLHYIVEEKNPHLKGEPIRLHKEFMETSCSLIDVIKVRDYANKFASGLLDPATGEPPITTTPPVDPDPVDPKAEIYAALDAIKGMVEEL
jgi:peptidoglycan hydrolase-like protein with peptidoglycan-binding domain